MYTFGGVLLQSNASIQHFYLLQLCTYISHQADFQALTSLVSILLCL